MPETPDPVDVLAVDASVLGSTATAGFGITQAGFVPKTFARLLSEKLALARALISPDLDLTSSSVIRKLLEVSALEDARTWAALATMYDNSFVVSATGDALSVLGEELGLPRPYLEARGVVKLTFQGQLTSRIPNGLTLPRGARMLTAGGHHVALDTSVTLSPSSSVRDNVPVVAFYPGPEHNLDPADPTQKIDRWNELDPSLVELELAQLDPVAQTKVLIDHTQPLSGGELRWPDARYRELVLRVPRSTWTVDAVRMAVSLVPGVRQVQVRDTWGGLDVNKPIFGNFNFVEQVFSSERDLGSPYYFIVLVAPTPGAIWAGPDGLRATIESTIEDLRPVAIYPSVVQAVEVNVGVSAELVVRGLPLPTGSRATVNASEPALALKARLLERVRGYLDSLSFGEPVRASEVIWALMNEPGVTDARNVQLLRFPPVPITAPAVDGWQALALGANVELSPEQIAVFVDDRAKLTIV